MAPWLVWALVGMALLWLTALIYWQVFIAEGAYLGQRVVTWLYNITAQQYDRIKQYDPEMEALFLGRPLAEALRRLSAPLVLDVATGTGRLPLALFEQPGFRGQVVGLDASRSMLEVAAHKLRADRHRLTLIRRDAAQLPFHNGTFDAVTCLEMVEFTPNPEAQLAEAIRVLRPGGVFVTTRRRGFNARLMPGKTHSREEFRALLERLGLAYVEILPWQVEYDLVWGIRTGRSEAGVRHPLDVLCCPECARAAWAEYEEVLACRACGTRYAVRNGIIEMDG